MSGSRVEQFEQIRGDRDRDRKGGGSELDEALVELADAPGTVHLLVMRASFSGRGGVRSGVGRRDPVGVPRTHVEAFAWFGGLFPQIRYDT
jgi:hypothetical protein